MNKADTGLDCFTRAARSPGDSKPVRSRKRRGTRGVTLIELLISTVISLLVGSGILALTLASYSARGGIQNQNGAFVWGRHSVDVFCDSIRNASSVQIQASPVINSALFEANATSVTCYTSSNGSKNRYWLDTSVTPAALKKTDNSGVTTVLVPYMTSLTLTYYTTGAYNSDPSSWHTTANPNSPTIAERPLVGAIGISATVTYNGYPCQISSFVRLRNSPL